MRRRLADPLSFYGPNRPRITWDNLLVRRRQQQGCVLVVQQWLAQSRPPQPLRLPVPHGDHPQRGEFRPAAGVGLSGEGLPSDGGRRRLSLPAPAAGLVERGSRRGLSSFFIDWIVAENFFCV